MSSTQVQHWLEQAESNPRHWVDELFEGYPHLDEDWEAPELHVVYHAVQAILGDEDEPTYIEKAIQKLYNKHTIENDRYGELMHEADTAHTQADLLDLVRKLTREEMSVIGI